MFKAFPTRRIPYEDTESQKPMVTKKKTKVQMTDK
jgi:hypothetical protein